MGNKRITELDALRGFAAACVVIYHFTHRYNDMFQHSFHVPHWLHYGNLGVQLFFIISGFVIFLTLNRTQKATDFIVSRLSRLYPAYWVAIALTFTAAGVSVSV